MCDCIATVNALLADRNAELECTFNLLTGREYPKLGVLKKDKRNRQRRPLMIPTFCPFCGERYEPETGVEELPLNKAETGP
ncbi:MAG TPA: hypothetical protein VLL76_11160 [Candidatus Omnitrophota bacterium]|nr:hypothetical protein [Candidatus Omnitrophota bacterium]